MRTVERRVVGAPTELSCRKPCLRKSFKKASWKWEIIADPRFQEKNEIWERKNIRAPKDICQGNRKGGISERKRVKARRGGKQKENKIKNKGDFGQLGARRKLVEGINKKKKKVGRKEEISK